MPILKNFSINLARITKKILDEMHKAIIGQELVLKQVLASVFSRGHCLLVGVPGLAKTALVSSLAQILDLTFKRVQFTPDLMPSDITGTNVIDENAQGRREFRFMQGPLFCEYCPCGRNQSYTA
jgi:MoxR-like ATPase